MSDRDTITALQRNLAAAEVERLRLVAALEKAEARICVLEGGRGPPFMDGRGSRRPEGDEAVSDEHMKPFACGRCEMCERMQPQECLSPRGGCKCDKCRSALWFVGPNGRERVYTRAELLAFGERYTRVRNALLDSCAGCARGDAFEGEGIHTNDAVGRTLCALTPRQREALKP